MRGTDVATLPSKIFIGLFFMQKNVMGHANNNALYGGILLWQNSAALCAGQREKNMSIKDAKLVYNDTYHDASARIWECDDGTFLFQCLKSNGKDLTVVCPTLQNAMSLWQNTKTRLDAEDHES